MNDAERLQQAEAALIELTDQCGGDCNWDKPSKCPCRKQFWPAIESIRALRKGLLYVAQVDHSTAGSPPSHKTPLFTGQILPDTMITVTGDKPRKPLTPEEIAMLKRRHETRDDHLAWCKQRAREYVMRGDLANALASMLSDLREHPELAAIGHSMASIGLFYAMNNDADGMRRWIEGFR